MVYALQNFRHYLLGKHFKMFTDHSALQYLVNKPVLGGGDLLMVITLLGVWVWNSCEVRTIVRWYGSSVSGREWWSTDQCWWWISICTIVPCWRHRGSLKYKVTRLRNSWVWPYQPIVHLEELHSNFYNFLWLYNYKLNVNSNHLRLCPTTFSI